MTIAEKTVRLVLETIRASAAPLSTSDLARLLGYSTNHMWLAVTELIAAPRQVRVAGWDTVSPGKRRAQYDTRIDLPDVPEPERVSSAESHRRWKKAMRADPVRLAKFREQQRGYEAKYKAQRPGRVFVAQLAAEALVLLLGGQQAVSAQQVAMRAGIARRSADTALARMAAATPKAARIAGWTVPERGGERAPLFDLQVDLEDVPRPPSMTTDERNALRRARRIENPQRANLKQQEWRAQHAPIDKPRAPASPFAALNWKAPQ